MRSLLTLGAGFAASLALVVACSGGTTNTGGSGGTTFVAQSYCDQREARTKSCAPDGAVLPPYDRGGCTRDYDCAVALLANPDGYLRCRSNPDCSQSTSDDRCSAQAAVGTAPQADACAKKYAECKSAGGKTFSDDTCGSLNALNASSQQKVYACIEKPCDQIRDCIDATVKAIHPSCG
jgi:hypothetical protein